MGAVRREPRQVSTPILAQELCVEAHALVGDSGQFVMLEVLSRRLGVNWDQLLQAVAYARHKGWIEARTDSIALAKEDHGINGHGAIDGTRSLASPESEVRIYWPPATRSR
jgi:hypothetical protein